jgi:hypothetical protein
MPPVVRAAGLEPAREPGLSRPPLPIGLRAHGAGGRIRTDKHGGLSSADKPILVRRITWWPAPASNRENLFLLREAPLPI